MHAGLPEGHRSYGFSEGWAHYAEKLMWEARLGEGDPKLHIGQLLDALRGCEKTSWDRGMMRRELVK
ncbi:MAG: DUF885 family protein [Terriglobales bacterium]